MFTLKPGAQLFVFPVLVLALAMGTLRFSRFSGGHLDLAAGLGGKTQVTENSNSRW
jgi:hypothetical protein